MKAAIFLHAKLEFLEVRRKLRHIFAVHLYDMIIMQTFRCTSV
jgi:hypothetical protein